VLRDNLRFVENFAPGAPVLPVCNRTATAGAAVKVAAAVSTRFDARGIQITLLSVGAVVFVVVAVITALFPVEF
jgi:hypothetical protein